MKGTSRAQARHAGAERSAAPGYAWQSGRPRHASAPIPEFPNSHSANPLRFASSLNGDGTNALVWLR
jgi:hypothetical protein